MSTQIIYDIRDRRNKSATTSVRCSSDSETQVEGFAAAWADAIDNLIGGVIRSAIALLHADISGLASNVAGASSDVEEIASFQFSTSNGITKVEVNIPGILETLIDNDTGQVNLAAGAVAAFVAMMEDGITAGGALMEPCDVGSDDITTLNYARERSRNSGTSKAG